MQFRFYKKISLIVIILSFVLITKAAVLNSPRQMPLPSRQEAIASGDFNGDGFPDLVIGGDPAVSELGKIRVLLGKGNGNFQNPREYRVGYNPNSGYISPYVERIKVIDLNNDNNLDVVVAHNGQRSQFNSSPLLITVLLGDGTGNLQPRDSYSFSQFDEENTVTSIDFTDFNRDGRTDVILGCTSGTLGKIFGLINLGGGNFQPIGPIYIGANVFDIAATFANDDLNPDIVMTTTRGIVIVYGDGAFYSFNGEEFDTQIYEAGLVMDDFNSDGKPDIAVTERPNARLRVFLKGENGYPATPVVYQTNFVSTLLKSNDLNRDGHPDLIILHGSNGKFQIFYGNADGSFGNSETRENNLPISDISFADFDLNGKTDLAVSIFTEAPAGQAAVFLNAPNPKRYYTDFDGDGKSDLTIYRPNGEWWTLFSQTSSSRTIKFGIASDTIVAGNYDGDNKSDIAVFRSGVWYIFQSSDNSVKIDFWGIESDIPVPADYDNDGFMNIAVYRPSEGNWYIKNNNNFDVIKWGISTDQPVTGDYDGDGKSDVAVYRPSEGNWYILQSSNNQFFSQKFGLADDKPVQSDFDGDGRSDIAVYRPSDGLWYIMQSSSQLILIERFGLAEDIPVAADFDGDGRADVSVFRKSAGSWYYLKSNDRSFNYINWGTAQDYPVTANK